MNAKWIIISKMSWEKRHCKLQSEQTKQYITISHISNQYVSSFHLFQTSMLAVFHFLQKKKTPKRNSSDIKIALLKINNSKLFVLTKIPVSKAILFSFNSGKINPSTKYLETYGTLLSTHQRWEWNTKMERFFKSHNEINTQIQLIFRVRVYLFQSYILLLPNVFLMIPCIDTILKWLLCISA